MTPAQQFIERVKEYLTVATENEFPAIVAVGTQELETLISLVETYERALECSSRNGDRHGNTAIRALADAQKIVEGK